MARSFVLSVTLAAALLAAPLSSASAHGHRRHNGDALLFGAIAGTMAAVGIAAAASSPPPPVVYAPAPVYVAPPPPVVYVRPAPVYYAQPAPVYYGYAQPYGYYRVR